MGHDILAEKLRYYGLKYECLQWYLSGRKQETVVTSKEKKFYLAWEEVKTGVPQGSILGPLLFIIYINDLPLNIEAKAIIYANDTSAIITDKNIKELARNVTQTTAILDEWFKVNWLTEHFKHKCNPL